jgi:hypothetical protein
MIFYKTPREMFLARSNENKRKADKEYAMYIYFLIKGKNMTAKEHYLKSQKLYGMAKHESEKALVYVSASWDDLKNKNKGGQNGKTI